jgi:octaprenyl-diphosphate synthase
MQTMRRHDTNVSLADYYRVIDFKTAELFRVSCLLGARIGGYAPAFVSAAGDFGRRLGIAYQIYDDLVDFLGEERRIGKTLGTDLAGGKLTLPLMLLLAKVSAGEREAVTEAIQGGRPLPLSASADRMRELGIATGVVQAIDAELMAAARALEPHVQLAPAPFMLQLSAMLKTQVDALSFPRVPA